VHGAERNPRRAHVLQTASLSYWYISALTPLPEMSGRMPSTPVGSQSDDQDTQDRDQDHRGEAQPRAGSRSRQRGDAERVRTTSCRHEAERTLAERTRYILDDEAARRFLTALEQPSPTSERGLRRLIEKPSVLPEA
jgi:Protein of unknown function (DUF1778)